MASTAFSPTTTTFMSGNHGRNGEESSLTPRPSTAPSSQQFQPIMVRDDAKTPTRVTFGVDNHGAPSSAFAPPLPSNPNEGATSLSRGDSQHSTKSKDSKGGDGDSDDSGDDKSEDEASGISGGKKKKKKDGGFVCYKYPPCKLAFTRSEHLARHVRKHTGERPFVCHCNRRFSRLDNLRQHATTVHCNEEIPPDSLAATGTRFQRQVRTDRVRPAGGRSRPSTAGGQAAHGRGHQRNSLSMSSMTSNGSVGSIFANRNERRRPPTLNIADSGHRFSQEMYRADSPSSGYYRQDSYRTQSPGFGTPTSATFSTGPNSPHWSGMQSPGSTHSRPTSIYGGHRTPGRRLSVPSAGNGNPFQSPFGGTFGPPALPMNTSNMAPFSPSGSMISSPTTSTSGWSRRDSISAVEHEARRRTWHYDSRPPPAMEQYTSRLQNVMTPTHYATGPLPQPPIVPSQPLRLPGIESFDPLPRPTTPVYRQPSPMMIDTPTRPPMGYDRERPVSQHWEQSINGMNGLNITQGTPPADTASQWANEANRAVLTAREQVRQQPAVRFEESSYSVRPQTSAGYAHYPQHVSAPAAPITPRENKRQAWYHGPISHPDKAQRTSPAESSGSEGGIPVTPISSSMGEYNPGIVHSNGWVESRNGNVVQHQQHDQRYGPPNGNVSTYGPPQHGMEGAYTYGPRSVQQNPTQQHEQTPKSGDMGRLEALVAVATAEDAKQVSAAY
ncbi:uncharacterized protein RSE6_10896 [Rhynchosporium secalis]|uniref:C2H2-type domain-containing protein n=1 Tax=Rhynchosporium secalis TaxID=38038 RepID=A0A1E1MLL9_RHYSE|nr:uncharacterized protein RSE6_10896 [Rhynchosporium secalis]